MRNLNLKEIEKVVGGTIALWVPLIGPLIASQIPTVSNDSDSSQKSDSDE